MGHTSEGGGQEERIIALQLQFRNTIGHLLADSSAEVKRALLASLPRLCFFFHRSSIAVDSASAKHGPAVPWDAAENDTRDFLLSHIITYLNDRDSWLLRSHFFEAIVGIALLVGRHALEEYILPLMNQAMADSEEYVIGSVLRAFTRLAEGGLLGKHSVREKVREVAPLLVHPNPWLRECALRFIEAGGNVLPEIDHLVVISPAIRQCLRYEALELTYEALSEALDTPVPVKAYQEA
ncbi:Serine/threonine-protein kinase, partial [Spiromyces aspiralis]